jgi:threonine aldolase
VIFDKALARRFDARLKQSGQLPSKSRFYAAPFVGMLETDAFVTRAAHANAMARKLAEASPFKAAHPVEANAVFVEMDGAALKRLQAKGWRVYRFLDGSVRFMCSWATTAEAVEALAADLKAAL